ncbi:hypothetical protein SAMN05216577_11590 [Pseudomonas citronellolis]|uniref:DUF6916 domain-containing protein n=1 Tax=Pseudomonas citronellolis TaxID=53408 RepID=A0AAQ1HP69_9PSED|nr:MULTISPECIES: hypothetical protein [Pseudomonas]MCL6693350.1 hypothetical protein [Pseudomonas sp. R3.Fl]MCP1605017.1 hypothetical protein [Pseudomonas citronellolis]MCP1644463.1 hypothetical protein [Pseudomonas citronellolis]MCP1655744.1 hypothetical protein [Pseudomonas citronellolis]MCP1667410.1 hypothetical protein [Pseudomonas citronellolis]
MYPMPTREALQQATGKTFQLWIDAAQTIDVELLEVIDGIAMSPGYQCFSAHFALPSGLRAEQAVFRVSPPGDEGWLLLMSPSLPDEHGRQVLQAVFHMENPA